MATHETLQLSDFSFLYEEARAGLEIQAQIDEATDLTATVLIDAIEAYDRDNPGGEIPDNTAEDAGVLALSTASIVRAMLTRSLRETEERVNDQLGGTALSVRVLKGEGRKPIRSTYYSSGAVGT